MVTKNIASKILNSMYMRLHWLWCRATQGQFRHFWRARSTNLGNYVTKPHAAIHYRKSQPNYLTPKIQLDLLRKKTRKKEAELRNKTSAMVCSTCQLVLISHWDYGVIRTHLLWSDWDSTKVPSIYKYYYTCYHQSWQARCKLDLINNLTSIKC